MDEQVPAARELLRSPLPGKLVATCTPREGLERKLVQVTSDLLLASTLRLGSELGIFNIMSKSPGKAFTVNDIVSQLRISPRYVADIFLHLGANGILDFAGDDEGHDKWIMSEDHALVLNPPMGEGIVPLLAAISEGHTKQFHMVKAAVKSDEGIFWGRMPCIASGARAFFAPVYRKLLPKWIGELPQISSLMRDGRVADVGCGYGVSTIMLAKMFPNASFMGIDSHSESIDAAKREAIRAEIHNVKFACADSRSWVEDSFKADAERAKSALARPLSVLRGIFGKERKATIRAPGPGKGPWAPGQPGVYNVVTLFDAFHDMGAPDQVASECFKALKPGGALLLLEPLSSATEDTKAKLQLTTSPLYSGFQVHFCTPCGKHGLKRSADMHTSEGIGPTAGTSRHRALLLAAGFSTLEHLLADDQTPDAPGPRGFRLLLATKPSASK